MKRSAGSSNCSLHMKAYVTLLQWAYNKVVCLDCDTVGADGRALPLSGLQNQRGPVTDIGRTELSPRHTRSGITETTCREAQAASGPPRPAGSGEGVSGTVIWLSRSGSLWLRPAACKLQSPFPLFKARWIDPLALSASDGTRLWVIA